MAKIVVKQEYKELVKLFDNLTGSKGLWQVFNDCIEMYAISIQNVFTVGKKHVANEQRYSDIVKNYTKSEFKTIAHIFNTITDMLDVNPFRDLLGDLYMQLNFGSDALGQFFTPYSVSSLMAQISIPIDDVHKKIKEKGYITINEPTVGGGANIIAFCEYLHNNGINYQTSCIIQAQELSRLTALMCYVILSLLGCSAVIKIGDTLANPYTSYYEEIRKGSELWTTPMFHLNNCYGKC